MPDRRFLIAVPILGVLGFVAFLAASLLAVDATAAGTRARIDRTIKDPAIVESSGLARSWLNPHRLWTHNDSGGGSTLYAIGERGRTVAKYELVNARHWDWEAMASAKRHGVSYLWVGDIGDNAAQKSSIFVHRIREPRPDARNGSRNPLSYELKYPDGSHDAEALLVRPGSLRMFVVSKVKNGPGHIYAAPRHPSQRHPNRLRRVGTAPSVVTDGVFLNRHRFVLRGYGSAWVYRTLGATPRQFSLPDTGESIAVSPRKGYVLTGSEGLRSDIWRVRVP